MKKGMIDKDHSTALRQRMGEAGREGEGFVEDKGVGGGGVGMGNGRLYGMFVK